MLIVSGDDGGFSGGVAWRFKLSYVIETSI